MNSVGEPQEPVSHPFSPRASWITLAVLLAGALSLSFVTVRPFATAMLSALVLAIAFGPLHVRIERRVTKPSMAALVSTTIIVIAFLAPVALIITAIIRELTDAYQALAPGAASETANRLWGAVKPPLEAMAARVGMNGNDLLEAGRERIREAGAAFVGQGVRVLSAASGGVVKTIVAIGVLYFLLRDGEKMRRSVVAWSPLGARHTETLLDSAEQMVTASVYGVIAVALAQGALCALGVWMAGLPSPLLWGVAAAIVSVLPLFGSTLVWLPAAGVLFAQGSIGWGIFMLAWGAGIVGTVDNLVRPLVVGAKSPMHPLVIFVAILGGVEAFGLIGILAGPVTVAVTVTLFGILREEIRGPREP